MHIDRETALQTRSIDHLFFNDRARLLQIDERDFKNELVMNRKQHFSDGVFPQRSIDGDHGLFNDVRGAPLDRRIQCHSFTQRAQPIIGRPQLRQIAAPSEHRRSEAVDFCFFHLRGEELPEFWKLRIIGLDEISRFVHLDTQPLRDAIG